ncbi:hypothetical protein [Streptomyces sp. NPDC002845]
MQPNREPSQAPSRDQEAAPTVYDATLCAEELRAALAERGITLPSLCVDLPGFARRYGTSGGLIALGSCNTATAYKPAAVLRKAAAQ